MWTGILYAQSSSLKFKHLTVDEGLSKNTVTCILEDSKGFMWFGTWDGLNRYDGYNFTVYRNNSKDSTSIIGSSVEAMVEDKNGNIWVASSVGGLSKYNRETGKFKQFHANETNASEGLSSSTLSSIFLDRQGIIWVGTTGGGLNRLDPETETFTHYLHDPNYPQSLSDNEVTWVYEDSQERLWVGTDSQGLNLFDRANESFAHFNHDPEDSNSLSHHYVHNILEDSQGNIWVGTDLGLNRLRTDLSGFEHYISDRSLPETLSHNKIMSLAEDADGNLWIGTENGGLNVMPARKERTGQKKFHHFQPEENNKRSLNSGSIYSIYPDKQGNMWLGTFNGGVNWVDRSDKNFKSYKNHSNLSGSLRANFVNSLVQDKQGYVWIATDGGGLNRFDPKTETFINYKKERNNPNSLAGDYMTALVLDKKDNIWAGSWEAGITHINTDRTIFTRYQHNSYNPNSLSTNKVHFLSLDKEDNLWVATNGGGMNFLDRESGQFQRHLHKPNDPNSINSDYLRVTMVDVKGRVWVGSTGTGITVYDPSEESYVHYANDVKDPNSLSSDDVNTLFEDKEGSIWVGTNSGLNRYDPDLDHFEVYGRENGMASSAIMSIEMDDHGNLWMGTTLGIVKFNPETGLVRNYSQEDGLQGNEFNRASLKSRNGRFYFGGRDGFTVFHPDSIWDNPLIPPVYLTDFQILNKSVAVGGHNSPLQKVLTETTEIALSHDQSVFSFEFAALNYTIPEKNQYAYKMEGFDEAWNYVGAKRSATYTNLNPGEYLFKVKASNNDGVWNEIPTSIIIRIIPPWWKTWWFRLSAGAIMIGLVFGYYKKQLLDVEEQNFRLEEEVSKRTLELQQANTEINEANKNLFLRQEEINAQNEELMAANDEMSEREEEIAMQRDLLALQNEKLIEATETIENRNKEIRLHNESLDEEVKERTRELLEYNHQLEQFAFIAGHNLRAPVARILGLGGLLKLSSHKAEDEQFIKEKLIQTTEELDRVVKDINTILEIRKDNSLVRTEVDLEQQLKLVLSNIENEIISSQAEIIHDFSEVNVLYSVKPYIDSILFNLLHNAIKYRDPRRRPLIRVKTSLEKNTICLSITDNGLGIDLKLHQKKMFTLYQRFHTHVEGKGMGLYLVKNQVEVLEGRIEVESIKNEGTTFRIFLKNQH